MPWDEIPYTWEEHISSWDATSVQKQTSLGGLLLQSRSVSTIIGTVLLAEQSKTVTLQQLLLAKQKRSAEMESALQKHYTKALSLSGTILNDRAKLLDIEGLLLQTRFATVEVDSELHNASIQLYNVSPGEVLNLNTGAKQRFHSDNAYSVDLSTPVKRGSVSHELVWKFQGLGTDRVLVYCDSLTPYTGIDILSKVEASYREPEVPLEVSDYDNFFTYQVGNPLVVSLEDYIYLCANVSALEPTGLKPEFAVYYSYDEVA